MNHTPNINQLNRAVEIAGKIAALETQLRAIFQGQAVPASSPAVPVAKKRKLSPQAPANIRAAQKKCWAKVKPVKKASVELKKADAPGKKKSGITSAGRAKLAAAMKARWAARRTTAAPAIAQETTEPIVAASEVVPTMEPATEEAPVNVIVVEELVVASN